MKDIDEKAFGQAIPLYPKDPQREQIHKFSDDDVAAVLAAKDARRPLLLRGEPGVGKSQLAEATAVVLERAYFSYAVDALTEPRDLRWWEDSVERLGVAQMAGLPGSKQTPDQIKVELERKNFVRPGPLWWAFDWADAKTRASIEVEPRQPHPKCKHENGVVVLIDEIDKADPAVPNGLLEALGNRAFKPPWAGAKEIRSDEWPLVLITSNDERKLPNAFIRRCVVYDMELPQGEELISLLVERASLHFPIKKFPNANVSFLKKVAELVVDERVALGNKRPLPGQAEYLDLLRALLARPGQSDKALDTRLSNIGRYFLKKHGQQRQKVQRSE